MDAERKAELLEAVNTLIESADALELYKKLKWVYEVAARGLPVRLVGPAAALNPILELMLEDYPTAERVMGLIDEKREVAGLEGLKAFDRAAYMRELMAKKRQRQTRIAHLINKLRPDRDQIVGQARMELMQQHADRWHKVRLEREEEARESLGRRLTEAERNEIIINLWKDVDQELVDFHSFGELELLKPEAQRNPNGFVFKLVPKEKK